MNSSEINTALANVYSLVVPETVLVLSGCVFFLGSTYRCRRDVWGILTLAVLAAAGGVMAIPGLIQPQPPDMLRPLLFDHLALFIKVVGLVGGAVLVLFSWDDIADNRAADWFGCLLLVVAGLSLTAAANDLIVLFLALELISIPTYVILYLQRADNASREAATKYFLLSVFSTAILLFGFSYLYGMAGTTNLHAILSALRGGTAEPARLAGGQLVNPLPMLALVALVMVTAGLGFKITAVPFHFYAPDVYQGTTLPAAALLAFVPKVAGFVALIRVLGFVWTDGRPPGVALGNQAPVLFWILATMTMSVGNILALWQGNLRRILAYSSVAHAGYMLIGLAVAPDLVQQDVLGGVEAVLFYLVVYGAMTIGAFAVLGYLSTPARPVEEVDDLAGLSRSHPGIALVMSLFLFSLIGMPATAGFWGKLFLFYGAMAVPDSTSAEHARLFRSLALVGAINAAVAAWYYLRIVAAMYLRTPLQPLDRRQAVPGLAALWVCAVLTLGLGIYPQPLVQVVRTAAATTPTPAAAARQE